jgi:hypothetical protein
MGIIRGAACAYVMVTMIGYRFLIGGDYSLPASLLEHLAVPIQGHSASQGYNRRWPGVCIGKQGVCCYLCD